MVEMQRGAHVRGIAKEDIHFPSATVRSTPAPLSLFLAPPPSLAPGLRRSPTGNRCPLLLCLVWGCCLALGRFAALLSHAIFSAISMHSLLPFHTTYSTSSMQLTLPFQCNLFYHFNANCSVFLSQFSGYIRFCAIANTL